jgi:predicted lipoprotein with Yx(FWY)xxD motif
MSSSIDLHSEALWFLIKEHDGTKIEVGYISRQVDMLDATQGEILHQIEETNKNIDINGDGIVGNWHKLEELHAAIVPQDAQVS